IEALYLSACELTVDGVARLIARPLPRLVKLTLSNNELENVADALAAAATNLPGLRYLELRGTGVDMNGVRTLEKSQLRLTKLDVRRNAIEEADVAGIPFARGGIRS